MPAQLKGIIDVHTHSMLPSWYQFLQRKFSPDPPRIEDVAIPDWNAGMAIEVMDEHGIAAMVLSNPLGTRGMTADEAVPLARRMNEELAEIIARHPKRFGAFGILPLQDMDAALAELVYSLDVLGFDGVCLQTNFDGAYPGDPRFETMFAELDRRRAIAFVHPAAHTYTRQIDIPVIAGLMEYPFDSTRAMASFVLSGMRKRYPDVSYIATHGGGTLPFLAHRIAFVTKRRGTGFAATLTEEDVVTGLKSMHFDLAIATAGEMLLLLREYASPTQILLGFDFPMVAKTHIEPSINNLVSSGVFSTAELGAIARENALRIMPRLAQRLGHVPAYA